MLSQKYKQNKRSVRKGNLKRVLQARALTRRGIALIERAIDVDAKAAMHETIKLMMAKARRHADPVVRRLFVEQLEQFRASVFPPRDRKPPAAVLSPSNETVATRSAQMKTCMRCCTNNAMQKSAEVADGMRQLGNCDGMGELYRRGCFRHLEDVAYARIMLERGSESVDEIAMHLDSSYEGPRASMHRCDRVYPPS